MAPSTRNRKRKAAESQPADETKQDPTSAVEVVSFDAAVDAAAEKEEIDGPPPSKKCLTDQETQEQTQKESGTVQGDQVSQETVPKQEEDEKEEDKEQEDVAPKKEENGQEANGELHQIMEENQQQEQVQVSKDEVVTHDEKVSNGGDTQQVSSSFKEEKEEKEEANGLSVKNLNEEANKKTEEVPSHSTDGRTTTSDTVNVDCEDNSERNGNPQPSQELYIQDNRTTLPPGVPMGVPMALPPNAPMEQQQHQQQQHQPQQQATTNPSTYMATTATATATTTATTTAVTATTILTEKENIPVQYVGRIIGKGGEQIRDLQARAACKVDVDQNVPHGAPRVITYQGTRDKIDFARSLVAMLCKDNWKTVELPLGYASRAQLQVPSGVIGKIIGRGGEMIKELQSKSYAKIQVDHSAGGDVSYRTVTVIGNELSVKRAEEMINLIIANPLADASSAVDMLIREKAQGTSEWGSGPPYVTMPNNGFGMPPTNMAGGGGGGMVSGYGQQQAPMSYGSYSGYGQQVQPQVPPAAQPSYGHYGSTVSRGGGSGGMESEIFYAAKSYMGRIIGQKGVTINDLQKRSGCDIQINQNVPMGQDCEVHIKGSRQGIDVAKQMLNEILQMGPNHPYAGGQGSGGGGGGYQQPTGYMQQQAAYGQTQAPYQQHYGQQPQYGMNQNQYGYMQQTPMQQPTPQYGASYGGGAQPYGYVQQPQTQLGYQQPAVPAAAYSPWKTATSPDGQIYYYNEKTNETTWDKPAGMP